MNLNTFIWTMCGGASGYIIGVITVPYFNSKFNKSYSFLKQLSYVCFLSQVGFICGFIKGHTGKDVVTNIINVINK